VSPTCKNVVLHSVSVLMYTCPICFLDTWNAGEVTELRCRRCKTTFPRSIAPASCVAVGYSATTTKNAHSYISTDVLRAVNNQSLLGSTHQSDAELQETIGRGRFMQLSTTVNVVPLQSLRNALQVSRALFAFPFAFLFGFFYRCVICGNVIRRAWGDACHKSNRYATAGKGVDTVFGLPGGITLDPRRTGPAIDALHSCTIRAGPGRDKCESAAGESHWIAATDPPASLHFDQEGHYTIECSHHFVLIAIEMTRRESVRGHLVLALLWAWIHSCKYFFSDCTCMLCRHVLANKEVDLAATLSAFFGAPPDGSSSLKAKLTVDERFAVFQILRDIIPKPAAHAGAGSTSDSEAERAADTCEC
jgi:hypothetical protein